MKRVRVSIAAVAVLLAVFVAAPARAADDARYALVHGCYALKPVAGGQYVAKAGGGYRASAASPAAAEGFRMQATALGRYLLFGKASDFLAADSSGAVAPAAAPAESGNWTVDGAKSGKGFTLTLPSAGKALTVSPSGDLELGDVPAAFELVEAQGCATFPEIALDVSGEPSKGASPWSETRGFVDAHFHWMAFEFLGGSAHCGRPWSPFGVAVALVDCPDHYPDGSGAVLENVLSNGSPYGTHDVHGWPSFLGWPRPESLTHEGSYYRWVERAWRGGLRLTTALLVDNAVLCTAYPIKRNSCDEMESIRLQERDMRALENYVDAQSGGPGKGWFRIVTDPFEARRVINDGKLAVILGIETSRLFECRELNGTAECDASSIDAGLDEVYKLGVRQMELVNKFDNALTGVAGDGGTTGLIVNNGNKIETGHYWRMKTCQNLPDDVHDNTQPTAPSQIEDDPMFSGVVSNYLPTGETPIYPPGPHCNDAGLTPLGEHLIKKMIEKRMIFDPDHMSVKARKQSLDLLEAAHYSGVVSSHSWSTPDAYPRIYNLGGFITPITGRTEGFVQEWKQLKPQAAPKYYWGISYGSDMNGLHSQPPARNPKAGGVTYPFKSFDGTTIDKQQSGTRTYDVNADGLAHYGLLPDWIEDLRRVGGDAIVEDMARGSEAYLQMWERAEGVSPDSCAPARATLTSAGLGRTRVGAAPEPLLKAAGQPALRKTQDWGYCVKGAPAKSRVVTVLAGRSGRVSLVGSTARSHRAGGIRPGDRAARLKGRAKRVGKGLFVRRTRHGRVFAYGVRGGRVRFVSVASRSLARSPKRLAAAVRGARLMG